MKQNNIFPISKLQFRFVTSRYLALTLPSIVRKHEKHANFLATLLQSPSAFTNCHLGLYGVGKIENSRNEIKSTLNLMKNGLNFQTFCDVNSFHPPLTPKRIQRGQLDSHFYFWASQYVIHHTASDILKPQ